MPNSEGDRERIKCARQFWNIGVGKELKLTFDEYLATISRISKQLLVFDEKFPHIALVEPRMLVLILCKLAKIRFKEYGYTDELIVPCDEHHIMPNDPFWIRFHNGWKNRNVSPSACRSQITNHTYCMTALVGVCAFIQFPKLVTEIEHNIDLPGSVHRDNPNCIASIMIFNGKPELNLNSEDWARPNFGCGLFKMA